MFSGGQLTIRGEAPDSWTIACDAAAKVVVNGANVPVGNAKLGCDHVNVIDIVDGRIEQPGAATIDLRGVKGPAFSHMVRTSIVANGYGGNTIYGSEFSDAIGSVETALINGRGGNDTTYFGPTSIGGALIHGGAGNDSIAGNAQLAKVYGDAGDDSIGFAEHGALQEWFGGRAMTPSDLGPSSPRI